MRQIIVLLCAGVPGVLCLAQTVHPDTLGVAVASDPIAHWVERLSKRFPPDLVARPTGWDFTKQMRSKCVYPSPDRMSLFIKPCETPRRRLQLSPIQDTAPKIKP